MKNHRFVDVSIVRLSSTGCLLGTGDSAGAKVWTYGRSTWEHRVHPVMAVSQIGAEKSARIYHYIYILWLYVYIEVEIELYSIHIYMCVCELSGLYIYMCTYIGCLVLYDLSSNMVSWKIQHLNRCFSRIFQYWNVRLYMISWHQTCSS